MSWQLIYTSAPRGLLSGQSGFCTVARSGDLREALVQRLEQISSYHYLRVSEAATANRNPTISAFRLLDLRGTKYHVCTRIQPCGLDFTARTNHLAHHLVFQPDELAQLPSPAAILRHWPGWMKSWQGEPRLLEEIAAADFAAVAAKSFLPAQTWLRLTGDAGRAAGLLESDCIRGCYLVCPPGGEEQVLDMFCETLQLLNPNAQYPLRPWRHPFTTFLQAEDNASDFQWRACQEGTPAYQQALQRSAPLLPLSSVRVPANSLVKTAREGLKPPAPPSGPPPSQRGWQLQRDRNPPRPQPITRPSHQPASRRSSRLTLIGAYAEVKLRLSNLQQWFSRQSLASRVSMGIFIAALLLGLMAKQHWTTKPHPAPPPAPSPAPQPAPSPALQPAPLPAPLQTVLAQPKPPDQKQLDPLSSDGRIFVFVTPDFARFELPIDQFGPFKDLILKVFNTVTHQKDILLSVSTNIWNSQPGVTMPVNLKTHELSAQTDSVSFSFDHTDFLSKTNPANPVVFETSFSDPPRAFSIQFRFSSPNHGEPFRLLILNENNPPGPAHMSRRWLNTNGTTIFGSLQGPLSECLRTNFTFLQGGKWLWQLRPFIKKAGQQPSYLYDNWPPDALPPDGKELDFAAVTTRLGALAKPSANTRLKIRREMEQLTSAADYPLGKDLIGLPDRLDSLPRWSTNAPPTQALFLRYLGELQNAGTLSNGWIASWQIPAQSDDPMTQSNGFQKLYVLWKDNVPSSSSPTNQAFSTNYFYETWQKLNKLESDRMQLNLLQMNNVEELRNLVPDSLDKTAYVGLFIIDPKQPRRGLEMIRFDGP